MCVLVLMSQLMFGQARACAVKEGEEEVGGVVERKVRQVAVHAVARARANGKRACEQGALGGKIPSPGARSAGIEYDAL